MYQNLPRIDFPKLSTQGQPLPSGVTLSGDGLTVDEVTRVAQRQAQVQLTDNPSVLDRIHAAHDFIMRAAEAGEPIYGVTSGFGGMANVVISPEDAAELQNNLLRFHKAAAGGKLPERDVRAAMLARANSLMRGVSGIRLELIERLVTFLNAGVTPHVCEFGSIGASGDLTPLAYIAGSLIGVDTNYRVDFQGEEMDSITALAQLGLPRLRLRPKEGLALMNGTSVMTGIAANCLHDAQVLLALTMGVHALAIQGLAGTNQSFHPFIHAHKAHPGQMWSADWMLRLTNGSELIRDELDGTHDYVKYGLIQDRYSLRCLPQYMGPMVDGIARIKQQIEVELNSANDNPLIDLENQVTYHCGNFLGQYIGVGMDQLRFYLGLLAKHVDVQIASLVAPEFNNGLPASLVGNRNRKVNMGLKALQITGNSMMPLLTFYGNSLVDHFPTHAEQFNQNINSQGFGSANLARQSVSIMRQYTAIALIFGVQAVDLRTQTLKGHYDARATLSPATVPLYEAVREVTGRPSMAQQAYIWDDDQQALDIYLARITADIAAEGRIPQALNALLASIQADPAAVSAPAVAYGTPTNGHNGRNGYNGHNGQNGHYRNGRNSHRNGHNGQHKR
jgi:phenylalanine ammonia-lyase